MRHREGYELAWAGCLHSPRYLSGTVLLGEAAFVGQNSSLKEREKTGLTEAPITLDCTTVNFKLSEFSPSLACSSGSSGY